MITSWTWLSRSPADDDADEPAALLKILQIGGAAIAHAAAQAADKLIDQPAERTFVGDLAFDSFGHGLAALGGFLRVAIGRAGLHRAERAHAAIGLERAALVENRFAGGFLGAGEEAADHHGGSAGGDGLGDVAGKFDAAVGDDRDAGALCGRARTFEMAVICGTPAPVTTRVVQIEPGPMPTLRPSTPSAIRSRAPS